MLLTPGQPVDPPSKEEILQQLSQIREREVLTANELKVLEYLADPLLDGRSEEITGKMIAADVFKRDLQHFNVKRDAIVRVTVTSLRKKLAEYYSGRGSGSSIVLQLSPVGYVLSSARHLPLSRPAMRRLWNARVELEQRTPAGFARALTLLDNVLREAPDTAAVLTLKAEALMTRGMYGSLPYPDLCLAREVVDKALTLPGVEWRAFLVQGGLLAVLDADWAGAFKSFDRALEMRADECRVHPWYTACLLARGQAREAILNMRTAVHDRGYNVATMRGDLSILEILGREYDAALETCEATIEMFPNYFLPHLHRAIVLDQLGDPRAALDALHETPLRLLERPVTWGFYAYFAGKCGLNQKAARRLSWLKTLRSLRYVPAMQIAIAALGTGRKDEAIEWLELGWNIERDPLLIWLYAYPFFDSLRNIPRFERLVDTIGIVRY